MLNRMEKDENKEQGKTQYETPRIKRIVPFMFACEFLLVCLQVRFVASLLGKNTSPSIDAVS